GDLAQHEAIAALDEANDALGHRAQRHDPRHADRDPGDRESVAAEDSQHGRPELTGSPPRRGGGSARTILFTGSPPRRDGGSARTTLFTGSPRRRDGGSARTTIPGAIP